jgi:hypothetical protein
MFGNLINGLLDAGGALLDMLPLCPFVQFQQFMLTNEILMWLNWFIPMDAIIGLVNTWLAAVTVWYVAKKGLRWANIIS